MLKNVYLKRLLKNTVFKPLNLLNSILPKDENTVMLYIATMGIRHNLKPVLDYMLENGYNKKYKIVCGIESLEYKGEDIENVEYITTKKAMWRFLFTKHVFYSAGQIPIKPSKKQEVIHLTHGAVYYKSMGALSNIHNGDEFYFSHMITTGEYFKSIVKKAYKCKDENVLVCNEPMTDVLFREDSKQYDFQQYEKVILWLPTFRQSDLLGYDNSSLTETLLIFKEEDYGELNAYLKQNRIKLIVKLHTAQNLDCYDATKYSNLSIYSNSDFIAEGYDLYTLLRQVDGLVGDYSSVSLQYLLMNKPMAFVIPDLEDYKQQRGFVFEEPLEFMPGNIVNTKEEFYEFLSQMVNNEDRYREKRELVRDKIHKYKDGNACKRVLEMSGIRL